MSARQLTLVFTKTASDHDHPLVIGFRQLLATKTPKRQWRALLRALAALPLHRIDACGCVDAREKSAWLHQNHGAFNQQVREAVLAAGAREGMFKAAYAVFPAEEELMARQLELKDFLSPHPERGWFK